MDWGALVVAVVLLVAGVALEVRERVRRRRGRGELVDLPPPEGVITFRARLTEDEHRAIVARLSLSRGRPQARA